MIPAGVHWAQRGPLHCARRPMIACWQGDDGNIHPPLAVRVIGAIAPFLGQSQATDQIICAPRLVGDFVGVYRFKGRPGGPAASALPGRGPCARRTSGSPAELAEGEAQRGVECVDVVPRVLPAADQSCAAAERRQQNGQKAGEGSMTGTGGGRRQQCGGRYMQLWLELEWPSRPTACRRPAVSARGVVAVLDVAAPVGRTHGAAVSSPGDDGRSARSAWTTGISLCPSTSIARTRSGSRSKFALCSPRSRQPMNVRCMLAASPSCS